ncbi:MAG: hypothetical protein HQ481_17220 [Alphaproteobacteria bacterium]|nr:hypothetical protein [Alphaproteobacteria bacterium]
MSPKAAEAVLDRVAAAGDRPIGLAEAALALAALERPARDLAPHRAHLAEMAAAVADAALAQAPADALAATLAGRFGYTGDDATYDDLTNADLAAVIERRRGLPVALGILYCEAARAQGWRAVGLNFPAHFLIRIEAGGTPVVLDPFHGGVALSAADLRALLRRMGAGQELLPEHHAAVPDRHILLRLQNNIKLRRLKSGDSDGALKTLGLMRRMAPERVDLAREEAGILVQLGALRGAADTLRIWLAAGHGDPVERREIEALLTAIGTRMN